MSSLKMTRVLGLIDSLPEETMIQLISALTQTITEAYPRCCLSDATELLQQGKESFIKASAGAVIIVNSLNVTEQLLF